MNIANQSITTPVVDLVEKRIVSSMNRIVLIILAAMLLLIPCISTSHAALMYATSASSGQLWTVDTNTAATTLIGGLPFSASLTVAYDIAENRIYTFNNASNQLYSIDPANGTGFVVGTIPYNFVHGFAYDPIHDILYANDRDTGALFTINTSNAGTTFIGSTNWGWVGGMDYDPINDILYALESANYVGSGPRLATINPATGAVTWLGPVAGLASSSGQWSLGFNPSDGMLYTSTDFPYNLIRINPATLATTVVGSLPVRFAGIASMEVPEPATMTLLGLGLLRLTARRKRN